MKLVITPDSEESSEDMLPYALQYAALGWYVFPCKNKKPLTPNGLNDASIDPEQITSWWATNPKAQIAVVTGLSGLAVVDIDHEPSKNIIADTVLTTLINDKGLNIETAAAKSGRGGFHLFYKDTSEGALGPSTDFLGIKGLDIRARGSYVVVAPSLHSNGKRYAWLEGRSPFEYALLDMPDFLTTASEKSLSLLQIETIEDGSRNDTLASFAGLLRSMGLGYEVILHALDEINTSKCNPPLPDEEIRIIAEHITKYPPYPTHQPDTSPQERQTILSFNNTDAGFSELFSFHNAGKLKYDHSTGKWLLWTGHYWASDDKFEILNLAKDSARTFRRAALATPDPGQQMNLLRRASQMEGLHNINSMLTMAGALPGISTVIQDWDKDQFLLGVPNGTVDLRTGEFYEGKPEDLIRLVAGAPYDKTAQCPRWIQFVNEIFDNNTSVVEFVHHVAGYSLTGSTKEQGLFMLIGKGANGKSVFLEVLRAVFAEYSFGAPFSTFERSLVPSQNSNDIAALAGKRLVTTSESMEGITLNEAKLKQLTGGDVISARFLHKEFFQFIPVCKIFLATNHPPRIHDDSEGFWRRIKRIDFPVSFEGGKADANLTDKLKAEAPGILNWAIEGCLKWQQSGLMVPSTVTDSVNEYRKSSDPLDDFLQELTVASADESVTIDDLYKAYRTYASSRSLKSYEILSLERFQNRMGRTYKKTVIDGHKCYTGLKLLDDRIRSLQTTNAGGGVIINRIVRNS